MSLKARIVRKKFYNTNFAEFNAQSTLSLEREELNYGITLCMVTAVMAAIALLTPHSSTTCRGLTTFSLIMNSKSSRQAPIQSSSINRRRMTQRRSEISDKIRKSRRSERVAKRRFATATDTTVADDHDVSIDEFVFFVRACLNDHILPSSEALEALQRASSSSRSVSVLQKLYVSPDYVDEIQNRLPKVLVKVLVSDMSTMLDKLNSARILTNIFAGPPGLATKVFGNIIADLVKSLASCIHMLVMMTTNIKQIEDQSKGIILLAGQISWAIGNVCADDIDARALSMERGVLEVLIRTFNVGLKYSLSELCRNAVWALSNLSRGDETSALPFLRSTSTTTIYGYSDAGVRDDDTVLKVSDIVHILSAIEFNDSIWNELKKDICWLLAFLTAKEDGAVAMLCQSNMNSPLCFALLHRFSSIIKTYKEVSTHNDDAVFELAVNILPCIRAIGNIATACNGIYVRMFLKAIPGTLSFTTLLAGIIELPLIGNNDFNVHNLKERSALASESTWIAGALLVDAGVVDNPEQAIPHPSSDACLHLCPALCKVLSASITKIELKREAAFALWNAVSMPPEIKNVDEYDMDYVERILRDIAVFDGMISSLCNELLHTHDTDANLAALMLISGMLTRLQGDFTFFSNLKRRFSEEGIVDALDKICEKASSSFQTYKQDSSQRVAEIAADLIDDFFSEEFDCDDGGDHSVSRDVFTFEPPVSSFNIVHDSNFISPALATPTSGNFSLGQGRGRGKEKTLPAWMKHK